MKKEVMNLKEGWERYLGGLRVGRGGENVLKYNLKNKPKNILFLCNQEMLAVSFL